MTDRPNNKPTDRLTDQPTNRLIWGVIGWLHTSKYLTSKYLESHLVASRTKQRIGLRNKSTKDFSGRLRVWHWDFVCLASRTWTYFLKSGWALNIVCSLVRVNWLSALPQFKFHIRPPCQQNSSSNVGTTIITMFSKDTVCTLRNCNVSTISN